jgi:exodeoxyribonuclease V gamma subunit
MLHDLAAGRSREDTLAREWRRGVLPPGRLGWRLAQQIADKAGPVADLAQASRDGRRASAVDVTVDLPAELGAGRRVVGTVTDVHGERVVKATYSSLGAKHWLDAWIPLLALCATHPGRGWSAGSVGRRRDGAGRVAWRSVDESATDLLADLVRMYDAGMRAPLPLPTKTSHAWACARRRPEHERVREAGREWGGRFAERDDAAFALVWGAECPLERLLAQAPLPGEEHADERTRLGALSQRLWVPMLERVVR